MKRILIISLILLFSLQFFGQADVQLARKLYNNAEYEKAAEIYDNLYTKFHSHYYFQYYIDAMLRAGKKDVVLKKVKKEMKKNKSKLWYKVDYGYVLINSGKTAEGEKIYKDVIKNLPADRTVIANTGNTFYFWKEFDYAEQVFLKGEKFFPGAFSFSLINIYSLNREYEKLSNAYLNYIAEHPRQLKTIKQSIKSVLKTDVNNEFANIFERTLIMRVQKTRKDLYYSLLIWFYTERNNFRSALIYARALDIRNKENGVRIYNIAIKAKDNGDNQTAIEAYRYLVKKGAMYPYFYQAQQALLDLMYEKIKNDTTFDYKLAIELQNKYINLINQLGYNNITANTVLNLADLEAYYLQNPDTAFYYLSKLKKSSVNDDYRVKAMIKTADLEILTSEPWKALLEYARVTKLYPEVQATDQARFKKALTYFYLGMFKTAKSQFDVLKGSTSKLISNDAIYWSFFIQENMKDSNNIVLKKYANAYLKYQEHNFNDAIKICDSIINNYPGSSLASSSLYLKSIILKNKKKYKQAALVLEKLVSNYGNSLWIDKALYDLAEIYNNNLLDTEKAKKYYLKLIMNYTTSIYSAEAKQKLKKMGL